MGSSLTFPPARDEVCARYRVRVLEDARPTRRGLAHRLDGSDAVLAWGDVRLALAAEVGEPQGVRTIVFDLVLAAGIEEGFAVRRFATEPGDDAVAAARVLRRALPAERLGATIKSLAGEGMVADWYPDLESFEEAALGGLAGLGC